MTSKWGWGGFVRHTALVIRFARMAEGRTDEPAIEERLSGVRGALRAAPAPRRACSSVRFSPSLVYALPMRGLSGPAHALAAIVAWVVAWWITEPVPIPVTSLLGASLAVMAGVSDAKSAFAPFGDPVIYLFLGKLHHRQGDVRPRAGQALRLSPSLGPRRGQQLRPDPARLRRDHGRSLDVDQQHGDHGHDVPHRPGHHLGDVRHPGRDARRPAGEGQFLASPPA